MKKMIISGILMVLLTPAFAKQIYVGPWPLKCGLTTSKAYVTFVGEDKTFNHAVMCVKRPNSPTEAEMLNIETQITHQEKQSVDIISIMPLSN